MLGGLATAVVLVLAGWAALTPLPMAWLYVGAVLVFEMWLARRLAAVGRTPIQAGAPPYGFTDDEARLVGAYRFYFTHPAIAQQSSSVLAAIGLSALFLAPWLTFKQTFLPAALVGLNLLAVARFTKLLAPLLTLRLAASRGDRQALRMLEVHDPAWEKIRAGNRPQ
jgi:hypothetical protein